MLERYAYINTRSEAGRPEKVTFNTIDVTGFTVWTNTFGNPTWMIYLAGGKTLLCVDDYGCENDMPRSARIVQRKKDL